jgi:hypothetical protein
MCVQNGVGEVNGSRATKCSLTSTIRLLTRNSSSSIVQKIQFRFSPDARVLAIAAFFGRSVWGLTYASIECPAGSDARTPISQGIDLTEVEPENFQKYSILAIISSAMLNRL